MSSLNGRLEKPRQIKIVSGGQTGVDRAALDAALDLGLSCGGWCPKGRRAADGVIPDRYPLRETSSSSYAERTESNVRDSDGTLILNLGSLEGGTLYTLDIAKKHGKPCLLLELKRSEDPAEVLDWIDDHRISVLNVAGPREQNRPGIHALAYDFLRCLLSAYF